MILHNYVRDTHVLCSSRGYCLSAATRQIIISFAQKALVHATAVKVAVSNLA